ncbi:MAG: peptidase M16 domain-containing protein [Bacteroidetes bacterium OLB11]|nr:MAG: peptidase M16 domain-containing protein [Bacteroidetes bacterium OLB11]
MFKKSVLTFIASIAIIQLNAQAKLIEKITKSNSKEIVIPYEKYEYPNGLTLIVHEDHSDPICHVDVTYHVGSAREQIGKSGFAHFFEHMMFQGSDNVADEQHFKIITEAGGTLNGTTNRDRTNYFETVPSNQLEKMLWLEADRMGFLLDAVTQQKFEVQRATVKNERGQNYDNKPYGLVQEMIAKNIFPYGHPYSWLTIGYIEDLNRVDVNDLKNFFLRWYGPNNAVLTVGGDVNTQDVVRLVDKYFGKIPKCPAVEKTKLPNPTLNKDRYVSMVDQYAKLPILVCAMPTVPSFDQDEIALDCLAEIIGGDKNSILYQNLVKTQKAISVSCYNTTSELAGNFQILITPKPGTPLGDMEKEIRQALSEFEKNGVSDDALDKFKSSLEAQEIYRLESVSGKVSQLASYQTFTGNANYITTNLESIKKLTKEDVMRVYNQYIKNKPMLILSVLTKGNENVIAAKDNYTVSKDGYVSPNYEYNGLKYVKAKDNFDRSKMPNEGPAINVKVPPFTIQNLNDIRIIHSKSDEIPIVVISIGLKGGRIMEQNDLSKAGLGNLFAAMMNEDTKQHTAEQMNIMLDKLGSQIQVSCGLDEISITVRSLKENIQPTLDLLKERIFQPDFKQETLDRIKNQTLENIKNSKTRAATMASIVSNYFLFGKNNVLGTPAIGKEETVKNITLNDIEEYYKKYISSNEMNIVVVGDYERNDAFKLSSIFEKLPKQKIEYPSVQAQSGNAPKTLFIYDIPKAAQTEFRIGKLTNLKYDATGEYFRCGIMNFSFGGEFNSRLNINLREDKGWTYGARGGFNGNDFTGSYLFSSGIKASATDSALIEIEKEFRKFHATGITTDELQFTKNAMTQRDARKYETLYQKAGFLDNILKHNLTANYVDEQHKKY